MPSAAAHHHGTAHSEALEREPGLTRSPGAPASACSGQTGVPGWREGSKTLSGCEKGGRYVR